MLYFLYIGSLILYFAVHSLLAAARVKSYFQQYIQPNDYRKIYNGISLFLLIPLVYLYISVEKIPLTDTSWLRIIGIILLVVSLILFFKCIPLYDWKDFLGFGTTAEQSMMVSTGLLAMVRHPLYLATILLTSGWALIDLHLWSFSTWLILLVYIWLGTRWEEQKLIASFGETYKDYRKKVPMLLPRWQMKKN